MVGGAWEPRGAQSAPAMRPHPCLMINLLAENKNAELQWLEWQKHAVLLTGNLEIGWFDIGPCLTHVTQDFNIFLFVNLVYWLLCLDFTYVCCKIPLLSKALPQYNWLQKHATEEKDFFLHNLCNRPSTVPPSPTPCPGPQCISLPWLRGRMWEYIFAIVSSMKLWVPPARRKEGQVCCQGTKKTHIAHLQPCKGFFPGDGHF